MDERIMEMKVAISVEEVSFSYFCAKTNTPAPTGSADMVSETIAHNGSISNTYIINTKVISG